MYQQELQQRLIKSTVEIVDFYRGIVLDTVEQELGSSANWSFIRARLLKALGDRGLSGRLRESIEIEFKKNQSNN